MFISLRGFLAIPVLFTFNLIPDIHKNSLNFNLRGIYGTNNATLNSTTPGYYATVQIYQFLSDFCFSFSLLVIFFGFQDAFRRRHAKVSFNYFHLPVRKVFLSGFWVKPIHDGKDQLTKATVVYEEEEDLSDKEIIPPKEQERLVQKSSESINKMQHSSLCCSSFFIDSYLIKLITLM